MAKSSNKTTNKQGEPKEEEPPMSPPPAKKPKKADAKLSDAVGSINPVLPPMKFSFDSPVTPKKKKKIWGNYLTLHPTLDGHFYLAYSTRADNGEGAYLRPMIQAFENDIQTGGPLRKKWRVVAVLNRRTEDGTPGGADMMKGPTTEYPWECFILVALQDGDTPQFLLNNLAEHFTEFVKESSEFSKNLPFIPEAIDATKPKPLAHFLKDFDVACLVKRAYSEWSKVDLSKNKAIMMCFFGDAEAGELALNGITQTLWDML